MIGNYLSLRQPKVKELIELLEKENSEEVKSFIEILNSRELSDGVKWSLDRISYDFPLFHSVWDYLDNLKGARFEIQSSLNGMPDDLGLRLLKNKEIPSSFNLFGKILFPSNLEELYKFKDEGKVNVLIDEGTRPWNYPLPGIIRKIEDPKYFLEFQ